MANEKEKCEFNGTSVNENIFYYLILLSFLII